MSEATLKEVMAFFEMPSKGFATEWRRMTDEDKAQIKLGIGSGSLTY
jgi:hypothetical protein